MLQKVTLRELERQLNNAESPLQKQWPGRLNETSSTAAAETQEEIEGLRQLGQQILENISEAVIIVGADGVLTEEEYQKEYQKILAELGQKGSG